MPDSPEIYKRNVLTTQLQRHKSVAAKSPKQLEFYILDERGELQQVNSNILFVRTGEKSGFSILPARKSNECTLYSYPQMEKNGDYSSSFGTKHRCANVFDVIVEVGQAQIIEGKSPKVI